jgi:hypothetical protein
MSLCSQRLPLRRCPSDSVDAVLDLVTGSDGIRRDAEILKSGGRLVSTLYAANEGWFAERQITASVGGDLTPVSAAPAGTPAFLQGAWSLGYKAGVRSGSRLDVVATVRGRGGATLPILVRDSVDFELVRSTMEREFNGEV